MTIQLHLHENILRVLSHLDLYQTTTGAILEHPGTLASTRSYPHILAS